MTYGLPQKELVGAPPKSDRPEAPAIAAPTGGKQPGLASYYHVHIDAPMSDVGAYTAECGDIIEALDMTFNEGEAFKALWRLAAMRQGRAKPGGSPIYDADKVAHYGARVAAHTRDMLGRMK